jgi:hypothetical protein
MSPPLRFVHEVLPGRGAISGAAADRHRSVSRFELERSELNFFRQVSALMNQGPEIAQRSLAVMGISDGK